MVPLGLNRTGRHNPSTGMGIKGSSRINRGEEADVLVISERERIGERRETTEPKGRSVSTFDALVHGDRSH